VAITNAIREGKPLIERVVTVTGAGIKPPANLLVRVGTLVSEVLRSLWRLKGEYSEADCRRPDDGFWLSQC
jgi:Na+-translocating ferredoxin:NAD+ oxidoreductase subunit C